MKELLTKIQEAYDAGLRAQERNLAKEQELNKKEERLSLLNDKIEAKSNDLNAKERILNKYEDFEKSRDEVNTLKSELKAKELDINIKYKIFLEDEKKFIEDKKKHDDMVEMYKTKSARINKVESDLAEEKKNLRQSIIKEFSEKLNG